MIETISLLLGFLNKNIGLITLSVGGFAIALYIHQKKDYKRDVAKLILQEIRYAESQIKVARERNNVFLLSNRLLPTNNWYGNVHLFVGDLEETDRDSISDFYSKVSFLDKVISHITEFKINNIIPIDVRLQQMPTFIPARGSITVAPQGDAALPPQLPPQGIITQQFQLNAEIILKEVTDTVEFLYNTPAADKLRELSRKKWYQIL